MKFSPVLVTPPAIMPVTLEEAKAHLRVDFGDDDNLIEGFIRAATDHLDGWTGVLGRCLIEQEWRQDFDNAGTCVHLPLGPVISVVSIIADGETVDPADYVLKVDGGGRTRVEFTGSMRGAGSITYKAGSPTDPELSGISSIPAALKIAVLMLVAHWFENRKAVTGEHASALPFAVETLIAPYRRVRI